MKNTIIIFLFLLTMLSIGQAQIPTLLNQQGFLTDSVGVPLNGMIAMTFSLYTDTTAGTLVFSQSFLGVPVNKGAYAINLDVTGVSFNQQLWMETQVGTSILSPRTRLTSSPYSLNALSLLGPNSEATGTNSIAGGKYNRARGSNSVVVGGGGSIVDSNSATGNYNFIGGGRDNLTSSSATTIAGGQGNIASGNFSAVSGGWTNTASGTESFVGGGQNNIASGENAVTAGGYNNEVSGGGATIGGGRGNTATASEAFIGGGGENVASGANSTIGGGQFNYARGSYSSILGGGGGSYTDSNSASGMYSTVAGGRANVASGNASFAAGRYAHAEDDGSFVWNSSTSSLSSTDSLQFIIKAENGVGINTNSPDNELHIQNSSSDAGNSATLELEAAGLNVDADATIVFNVGKDVIGADQTKWSLGLDDTNEQFVLSKDDSLENNQLFKVESDGTLHLYNTDGISSVRLYAEEGTTGAQLDLREKSGGYGIVLDGEEGSANGGADISMYDGTGNITINFDANYNGSGKGRVTTDEIEIQGGSDFAEPFELTEETTIEPGTVMVIDEKEEGKLKVSESAYDKKVAGIVSGAGGVSPGLTLRQEGMLSGNTLVAIAGRVYCKVDAQYGSIEPGDLLTTSDTPGHAMKAQDVAQSYGTVIGKAMTSLQEGKGLVLVLVNRQ